MRTRRAWFLQAVGGQRFMAGGCPQSAASRCRARGSRLAWLPPGVLDGCLRACGVAPPPVCYQLTCYQLTYRRCLVGARKWGMLGVTSLSVIVVSLDLTILNIALPAISAALPASPADLQWIVDAYSLTFAAVMLPAGLLGDRLGRRR